MERKITKYLFDTNFRYEQISVMIHSGIPISGEMADEFAEIENKTRIFAKEVEEQTRKEVVEGIEEELKKQVIYVKTKAESDLRDKDNIVFSGVNYRYMESNRQDGFVMALSKTIEFLSQLKK